MSSYIGIDIGGTKCAVVKGDSSGVAEKICFATTTRDETVEHIFASVRKLMPAAAIGISCGGPLDEDRGIIMSPPNLPGWDDVHIVEMLESEFGVPTYICNDANACALAEWRFGAGRGCENMIFLTFGTGLGAGLILNGRLYSGTNGNAGEVGHIRLASDGPVGYGKAGSFEGFCSGGGIAALARAHVGEKLARGESVPWCKTIEELENISTKTVAENATKGDALALSIFGESAHRLGEGLSILIDILNPQRIVIGSVYARAEQLFVSGMREVIERETLTANRSVCEILPATLGDSIGDIAALTVAIEGERLRR